MSTPAIVPAEKVVHVKQTGTIDLRTQNIEPTPQPSPQAKPTPPTEPVKPVEPTPPPESSVKITKPSTDKMAQRLRDKFAAKPEETPKAEETPETPETTPETPETPETTPEPKSLEELEKPVTPPKKDKVNPWKLVDEWKKKNSELEQQLIEAKKAAKDEASIKAQEEELKSLKDKLGSLEGELKFYNYQGTEEFKSKYEKPYADAFAEVMTELKHSTVIENGEERAATPQDILRLVNEPDARKAKAMAKDVFGDIADDAMRYRTVLKGLWDKRSMALDQAKKDADAHFKALTEERQGKIQTVQSEIAENWNKFNETIRALPDDREFFNPPEGNQEIASILESGFKAFDEALNTNPGDLRLSSDARKAALKAHAAARWRSAGYSVAKHLLKLARAENAELKARLEQYEESTPGSVPEGRKQPSTPAASGRVTDQVFARLRSKAR